MKIFFGKLSLAFVFVFLSLIALNIRVLAQDLDDVTISGKVVDANNAPVAGATVTAILTTTGAGRSVAADDEGRYRIVELAPGIYRVKASMQGFGAQEKIKLETVAGQ